MVSKTIIAGLVAVAFVAGSIMTGTMAHAAPNGQPFQELWDAIDDLQTQIDNISLIPGPQGDPGADGQDGLPGADGQDGLPGADGVIDGSKIYQNTASAQGYGVLLTANVAVNCNLGDKVLGGGWVVNDIVSTVNPTVTSNGPLDADTWYASFFANSGQYDIDVYAICIDLP